MAESLHRGVAQDDPRNQGPIHYFRPPDITWDYVRGRLAQAFRRETPAQIEDRVARFMNDMAERPPRPPPPLSLGLESVADPMMGLGVHPDVVEQLWRLDRALPRSSRWVFWGHPSLVHPRTGIVFGVAIGSIGIVARLPASVRDRLAPTRATSLGEACDISAAGPEWRYLEPVPAAADACAAFDFAGDD